MSRRPCPAGLLSDTKSATVTELQVKLDRFRDLLQHRPPHRAIGPRTPARLRRPDQGNAQAPAHHRRAATTASARTASTRRAASRALSEQTAPHRRRQGPCRGEGVAAGHDLDVRVITEGGELLRHLTLVPTKAYPATGRPNGPGQVLTLSSMSRDSCPGCLATQHCALGRIRTCDTRFRKPMLYPLSYEGRPKSLAETMDGSQRGCGIPSCHASREHGGAPVAKGRSPSPGGGGTASDRDWPPRTRCG